MKKYFDFKRNKSIVNFIFLGMCSFVFIIMLITNNSYNGMHHLKLSLFDICSAIISIILMFFIVFNGNKINKR